MLFADDGCPDGGDHQKLIEHAKAETSMRDVPDNKLMLCCLKCGHEILLKKREEITGKGL